MRRIFLFAALVAAVALPGSAAKAGSMYVDYAISSQTFLPALGAFNGPASTGQMTVRYNSATGSAMSATTGTVFHGGARVLSGTNMIPINFTVFGSLVTGFSTSVFGVGNLGTLASSGTLNINLNGTNSGMLHCTGALCTGVVGIPASAPVTIFSIVNSNLVATGLGAVGIPSTLTFLPIIGTAGGQAATTYYTATEISRHFVPEPSTLPLLGMGLALVGVAGRRFGMKRR